MTALQEKHVFEISQMEGFVDEADTALAKQLESLASVFEIAAEADTPTEVSTFVSFPAFPFLVDCFCKNCYSVSGGGTL